MDRKKAAVVVAGAVAALALAAKIDETDVVALVAYKAIDIIKAVAAVLGFAF